MVNTECPWQVCTSGRRDSTKDAHHCKTIHTWDRPTESLRLMWLRELMVWSGKTNESQRNKFIFWSALAMTSCMPLSKITCNSEKFAYSGFCIHWWRGKQLIEWLHIWVICSRTTRKSIRFCHVLSQGTKHGATILSLRPNGKANNGNTSILPRQRNPKMSIRVPVKSWWPSLSTAVSLCLSTSYSKEPQSMRSAMQTHWRNCNMP